MLPLPAAATSDSSPARIEPDREATRSQRHDVQATVVAQVLQRHRDGCVPDGAPVAGHELAVALAEGDLDAVTPYRGDHHVEPPVSIEVPSTTPRGDGGVVKVEPSPNSKEVPS